MLKGREKKKAELISEQWATDATFGVRMHTSYSSSYIVIADETHLHFFEWFMLVFNNDQP